MSAGYDLSSTYTTVTGGIVCEFERTVTVPSGSESLMYDLTNPLYILYAAGSYSNGIQYHGSTKRYISTTMIDLTPPPAKAVSA